MKAAAIILNQSLKPYISKHCFHMAGNGGSKAAVRLVHENIKDNSFVFRTDVKSYYASIDHEILFRQLEETIKDPRVLGLLWDYLRRSLCYGGQYWNIKCGISLGCSLSPIMGALYLKALDDCMAKAGLFYVRFMDDWVILSPTRWKLRVAIKIVNQVLGELKLEKHPDKTYIGKTEKGFDFLGYRFEASGLKLAPKPLVKFAKRIARLYEQGTNNHRIGQYIRHFIKWSKAGIGESLTNEYLNSTLSLCISPPIKNQTYQT